MGFLSVLGPCVRCHRMFTFNPDLVPSIRVTGFREPVCRSCVEEVNPVRVAKGLDPIQILPGAYDPTEDVGTFWDGDDQE